MNMYSWQVIFTMTWLKMEAWEIPIYWGPAAEEWLVKDAKSRGNRGRKNMERQYYIRNTGTTRLWLTISQSLPKLMSIDLMMQYNHLLLCHPLLLLPSVFPSIRVFSNESALLIRWSKYWSFTFSISPSSEYSGLISFRIDWFDLHAVQQTLKSLL